MHQLQQVGLFLAEDPICNGFEISALSGGGAGCNKWHGRSAGAASGLQCQGRADPRHERPLGRCTASFPGEFGGCLLYRRIIDRHCMVSYSPGLPFNVENPMLMATGFLLHRIQNRNLTPTNGP
jgi:hypothetical protein